MNIKFKTCLSGIHDVWNVGDVAAVPKDFGAVEATRFVEAGIAEETTDLPGRVRDRFVEVAVKPKAGVEYAGKRLFGAAAAAVQRRLAKAAGK